jgi:hypothetical protein
VPDVDHLYALPLEEFIPARDAAAKELRKAGDRETAAIVAKLAKPTPPAWTANQVAREHPDLIEAMLDAGEELRVAQEAAVAGAGARGLRDATLAERRAVDAVMATAVGYKPAGKPLSRAMADRLRTTLHAAAGDEAIREALAHGRLVDEAQAGGAWPFALEPSPPGERPAKKRAAKRDADGDRGAAATKRGAAEGDGGEAATKRGAAAAPGAAGDGAATKRGAAAAAGAAGDGAAAKRGAATAGGATKRGAKPSKLTDEEKAAERERKAGEAREAAERERAEREARKALEAELREARTSLRVRERVFTGASEDAEAARDAVSQAKAALEQARKAVEDAVAEAEAAERVREQAGAALDQARDTVARLEEKLD